MALSTDPYALVVDDDAIIQMHGEDVLLAAGFRVLTAFTSVEALALLCEHGASVTLLFTDVDLGSEPDGFALARQVAKDWPEIAIVVASGHIGRREGDLPERAVFITKPFSAEVVHDHLREILPDGKKPEALKNAV
jgi:CheY-like chemotaxis protein